MKMEIWSGRSSDGSFRIRISDEVANVEFVMVKMTPENFAYMLANQPVECEGQVSNLHRVGKTRVAEERTLVYNSKDTDKATVIEWLRNHHKDDGWEMNDTLSSQRSMVYVSPANYYVINYTVEKWV